MTGRVRIGCCVPFCPRWHYGTPTSDMICWGHWKRIPLARRKAYDRAVAERASHWIRPGRRIPRWMQPRPHRVLDRRRAMDALHRLWNRLKRDAIERAL